MPIDHDGWQARVELLFCVVAIRFVIWNILRTFAADAISLATSDASMRNLVRQVVDALLVNVGKMA